MPAFNRNRLGFASCVYPGDTFAFYSNEAAVGGDNSVVMCPSDAAPNLRRTINFTSTVAATIYGSNTPPTSAGPQNGVSLAVLAANGSYVDTTGFQFYWASATGSGTATILAHVS